ncbi:regulator of chromosome condensation 1/beta-lactamase-inhibitor protein II [Schizophyllum amplum]|uniref:Regulator of chromosome condensation 1/beta-lactamase-inhibitor protein II n=1 Tax=Schizophyllum amplum TaxID=97359 RepID=A0A550CQE4_9AGAR|nr:regulator of chromosome condensation 1/beta-lactamase-inhibitor protein II [Auriculariopsis ampla]
MAHATLLAAGSNACGQLGNGSTEDSRIFQPASFTGHPTGDLPEVPLDLSSGANHTLVLLRADPNFSELWGSGDGTAGQMGPNIKSSTAVFTPILLRGLEGRYCRLIQASWQTSYAVYTAEGQPDVLISMGADDFGDLGVGKQKKGNSAGYHIVNLDQLLEDIDRSTVRVDWLAAGPHHVVLRLSAAHRNASHRKAFIIGWGACRHGQLGNITFEGKPPAFVDTPRIILIDEPSDPIEKCAIGHHHTVLLRRSGRISCLGSNRKSQISGMDDRTNVEAVGCTWHGTYAVDSLDGSIHGSGSNIHGQLGQGTTAPETSMPSLVRLPPSSTHRLKELSCGSEHILAKLQRTNGPARTEVWGWGWNEHGNLGTGGLEDVLAPAKIWPPEGAETREILGIWCGLATSWIATV